MKKICITTFLFIYISSTSQVAIPTWVKNVGAKTFPSSKKIFFANDFGAKSDTTFISTKAIQRAIDKCASVGGGVVKFLPGVYVTGSLFIKSNVELRIDDKVLILGSQNFDDYPEMQTRIAGIETSWPAALINLVGVKNAALTGKGIINARGKFCWDKYWSMRKEYDKKGLRWVVDYDAKRVRTVLVQNSGQVTIKDITFKNAGFWTIQLLYSSYLTVNGVVIKNNEDGSGPSTDGIDIDSSTWTLIENCDIDCNDDNFCLKAGRDWDGLRVNKPTEYVVIRKCIARRGAGLVTLGSETSGSIRHIYCTDLSAKHTDNGLRIKSATTRGGTVEDVYFVNSVLDSVRNAYQFNLNWYPAYSYSELPKGYNIDSVPQHWRALVQKVTPPEKGIPYAKNFYINNVKITNAQKAFEVNGLENSLIENFNFTKSSVTAAILGEMVFTKNWTYKNFTTSISQKTEEKKKIEGIEAQERLKQ
ncbi:MAG TPA: glycoside hydrolase family 28 protein [Chitinophagaceae bacterium]|nr:glycoside hydrolase family 28 protein [Chitinophagaceae bacterium]